MHSLRLRFGDKSVIAPVLMDQELDESASKLVKENLFSCCPAATLTYPVTLLIRQMVNSVSTSI